jgi:hypothetical protein
MTPKEVFILVVVGTYKITYFGELFVVQRQPLE